LPESCTEIGKNMFEGCVNLTDIVLPTKCNYIGSNAFLSCENLQNVYLYNKHWNVGDTVLDLTDKSAAEVAQLLTSAEYRGLSWSVVKATAPVLHNEFDEHFVDFTVENPNNTPQVLTVSLTLKDGSGDSIEEVYHYSETYTIGANKSITDAFDMPLTEDYSGMMAFSYAELVAYFENSDEINNNEVCEQNGHSYGDTVIAPTCTEQGYTIHRCNNCGATYKDNFVDALGHISSDWIIDVEATTETEGSKHKECTRCGVILETATIPKLPSEDDTVVCLITEDGNNLTDENGNLLIAYTSDHTKYLVNENSNRLTDEQENLLTI
jgi:hypothetical protein